MFQDSTKRFCIQRITYFADACYVPEIVSIGQVPAVLQLAEYESHWNSFLVLVIFPELFEGSSDKTA